MPYIAKSDRVKFKEDISEIASKIETDGELNYVISRICHEFIKTHGKRYSTLNTVHGVLNCVDKELYRRITSPYEDEKIKQNGDI